MRGGRAKPRRLGDALRSVRAEAAPATLLAAVQDAWPAVAGESVAAEATPVAERDGVVTIACHSAVWAQELNLMQDEILGRLNAAVGTSAGPLGGATEAGVGRGGGANEVSVGGGGGASQVSAGPLGDAGDAPSEARSAAPPVRALRFTADAARHR